MFRLTLDYRKVRNSLYIKDYIGIYVYGLNL